MFTCPTLETPRLLARKLDPADYERLFSECSDAEVKAFFGFTSEEAFAAEQTRRRGGVTMYNRSFEVFYLTGKSAGTTIGWIGFHTWYLHHHRAELGYGLFAEEWKKQGLMSEIMPAVLRYGFETMGLNRVEAMTGRENTASQRLLKKHGFAEEGVMRGHFLKDGIYHDSVVFGLLHAEYRNGDIGQRDSLLLA